MELYVHIPFCRQKCRYCDFVSFPGAESGLSGYLDALLSEAELIRPEITEPIRTVYFGGGTPSLIPPASLRRLLRGLRERLPLDGAAEWTSEANPGTLTASWLDAAAEGGINRISLGMQSAQDRLLSLLGRIHRMAEVERSVTLIRRAGFQNLNLDLIFGLPTQTLAEWEETLEIALSLSPEHLSAYGLIPEEGTPLWEDLQAGRLSLPEEEAERDMYETLLERTARHGLCQYEISNFSRPGRECRHNIGYWDQTPYVGLGCSAASMVLRDSAAPGMTALRWTNTDSLEDYLRGMREGKPVFKERELIPPRETRFETMMLGLRMNRGVREDAFLARHGVTLESCYGSRLSLLQARGLLLREDGAWRLTRKGMDLQNMVLVELMDG